MVPLEIDKRVLWIICSNGDIVFTDMLSFSLCLRYYNLCMLHTHQYGHNTVRGGLPSPEFCLSGNPQSQVQRISEYAVPSTGGLIIYIICMQPEINLHLLNCSRCILYIDFLGIRVRAITISVSRYKDCDVFV